MEVREPDARYLTAVQRTELGEFPADWQVVPLDEFDPFITSGSRGWAAYYADIGSTFLRITNLSRSCIYPSLSDLRYVAVPPDNSEGVRTALRTGDVLISITADIGIVGLVTEAVELPAHINQHIALVRFDGREVNSRYVAYFLAGAAAQRRFKSMTDAGAKAGMNLAGVRDVLAALPPNTEEQAAIADALTDADALIDSLEQLLTKKRQIKQGAMQELLTGKRRLPGFTANWETARLGRLLKFQTGFPFPSHLFCSAERGLRLIRNRDLKSNDDVVHFGGAFDCEFVVKRGDVLVGMDGDFMPCLWDGEDALLNQRVGRVLLREGLDPTFAYYFLIGKLKTIEASTGSTTVKHLSHGDVEGIEAAVPELAEQMEIGASLRDLDMSITALESRLTKARALKQAMAQALLTGRIRMPLAPQEPAVPVPPPEGVGALGSGPARTQEPTA